MFTDGRSLLCAWMFFACRQSSPDVDMSNLKSYYFILSIAVHSYTTMRLGQINPMYFCILVTPEPNELKETSINPKPCRFGDV